MRSLDVHKLNLCFDNEQKFYMSSKIYEANSYGHNLNLSIILH